MNHSLSLTSSDIKNIRALQQKKFRLETGFFVVEGVKMVEELVNSEFKLNAVYTTQSFDFLNVVDGDIVRSIKEKELERISGLRSPNRILAIAQIREPKPIDWIDSTILFLDGINDPGNVGTIIRTAKWFGIKTIICSTDCADAYDRKVVQSTMGALFHVNLRYENLAVVAEECKKHGFSIIGAAMNGDSIYTHKRASKTALVIGSESHGISQSILEKCDFSVSIPNNETERKVESLNAGIATAILLSELTRPT